MTEPECTWCAVVSEDHGDCDCLPHDCSACDTPFAHATMPDVAHSVISGRKHARGNR